VLINQVVDIQDVKINQSLLLLKMMKMNLNQHLNLYLNLSHNLKRRQSRRNQLKKW